MVGNGLDLQYGLKTKYKDFYDFQHKVYMERKKKEGYSNFIYESLFSDKVNDYENWSDFELALGRITLENTEIIDSEGKREQYLQDFYQVTEDLVK